MMVERKRKMIRYSVDSRDSACILVSANQFDWDGRSC